MTRVLIDTCAFSALFAGDERIAAELERGDEILLSPIVLGELLDGFEGGSRKRENRARLEAFRQKPRSRLVPILDSTSE
jgi:tRNA(fMet)-specific endonuclease VapC